MFKKCQVVMLPTNEKAAPIGLFHSGYKTSTVNSIKQFHLYILSDEEIKEGDWVYSEEGTPNIQQATGLPDQDRRKYGWKKVIATTSLLDRNYNLDRALPQPSQSFIKKYVEQYDKNIYFITEVEVEYENNKEYWAARNQFNPNAIDFKVYTLEEKQQYTGVMFDHYPVKLKVNSDNTVNIRKVKDSWNRDEVLILLQNCWSDSAINLAKQTNDEEFMTFSEWLKNEL